MKREVIVTIIVIVVCLILLVYRLRKESVIDKNGAYVIGVVTSTDDGESGIVYKCKYYYKGKSYSAEFTDLRRANDSLIFFKISRDYPYEWKFIQSTQVPGCFRSTDMPELGWSDLPTCDSLKRSGKH